MRSSHSGRIAVLSLKSIIEHSRGDISAAGEFEGLRQRMGAENLGAFGLKTVLDVERDQRLVLN
jgi:hypothetical protein